MYDRVAKVTVSFLIVWASDVVLMELFYLKRFYYGHVSCLEMCYVPEENIMFKLSLLEIEC